jgi:hypothetical protein
VRSSPTDDECQSVLEAGSDVAHTADLLLEPLDGPLEHVEYARIGTLLVPLVSGKDCLCGKALVMVPTLGSERRALVSAANGHAVLCHHCLNLIWTLTFSHPFPGWTARCRALSAF